MNLSSESDSDEENIFLADCLRKRIFARSRRSLSYPKIKLTFRFENSREDKVASGELFQSSTGVIWSYKAANPQKSGNGFELVVWLSEDNVSLYHIRDAEKSMEDPVYHPDQGSLLSCAFRRDLALDNAYFDSSEFHLVDYTLVLQTPLSAINEEKLRRFFKTLLSVPQFPNEIVLREVYSYDGHKLSAGVSEVVGCTLERCEMGCCVEPIIRAARDQSVPYAATGKIEEATLYKAAVDASFYMTQTVSKSFAERWVNERAIIYLAEGDNQESY